MLDHSMVIYLIAGFGACALSLAITPLVRSWARRAGFVDRPDGHRKTHKEAVALGGGAAIMLAVLGALGAVIGYAAYSGTVLFHAGNTMPVVCLAASAIGIVLLGLVDDFVGLRGRHKLLGQVAVTALLIYGGVKIEAFSAFGYVIPLGMFVIPATAFWLIGTTNAVNLIDGIDGLAGSVGFILSLTVAAICGWQGHVVETSIMLALSGAQLGFLRYNFAPAPIYLGDAGSMLIGLTCGTIAVISSAKGSAAMAFAVPIAVWLVPILDSFAALLRRKLTGRSMFTADRGHLHHSLLVRGWTVQQAALFIALISATTCLSAVLSFYTRNELYALLTVVAVMLFLVFTRTFGHIEFALVRDRMKYFANSLIGGETRDSSRLRESCIQLQGSREWGKLWAAIVESAEVHHLLKLQLSIHMPAIHEAFYATWECPRLPKLEAEHVWRVSHPLEIDGEVIGKMEIVGRVMPGNTISQIVQALEFLEPIEDDIRQIRESLGTEPTPVRVGRTTSAVAPLLVSDDSQLTSAAPPVSLVK